MNPETSGFPQYLKAFGGRMLSAMSGAVSVPFAIAAVVLGETWQIALTASLAVICFLFASYIVWRSERERAIKAETKLAVEKMPPPSADVWVNPHEAFQMVCDFYSLNEQSDPSGDKRIAAFRKFRQFASDGELTVRGRRNVGEGLSTTPHEFIPKEHWLKHDFQDTAYILGDANLASVGTELVETYLPGGMRFTGPTARYRDLYFRKSEVERLFSKAAR